MTLPLRPVGRTGLRVSELGVGAASLGNLYKPVSDAVAHATVAAALDAGFTYIDTAPHYGRGLSERRVGDALRGRAGFALSSKVGRLMAPDASVVDDREREGFRSPMPFRRVYDYSYDGVMRSVDASLQRLGLARIDLLYVHDIGGLTHGGEAPRYWEQLTSGGGFGALERLREEGAIAGFGLGVNEIAVCLDALRETRLDAILLAGRYTLLEQDALDELMPACATAGTSIIVGGPYNSGILATGTTGGGVVHYDYAPAPEPVLAKVRGLEAVCARHGVALPAAALQFALAHPQVISVVPGLARASRVHETVELYRAAIPADFWAELKASGLLRRDAPTPG